MGHLDARLTLYEHPDAPRQPVVCGDERPCQRRAAVRAPRPMNPGRTTRPDAEDVRQGTCGVWRACEPGGNWRWVQVRMRRTAIDSASCLPALIDTHDRGLARMRLVQDHLHTHTPGSFSQALAPQEAFDRAPQLARHETPLKGSGLKMAEIERSALARQGLDRRIGTIDPFTKAVARWTDNRTHACNTVQWKFTTTEARKKLKRNSPLLQD
jgi:hypothetical protein